MIFDDVLRCHSILDSHGILLVIDAMLDSYLNLLRNNFFYILIFLKSVHSMQYNKYEVVHYLFTFYIIQIPIFFLFFSKKYLLTKQILPFIHSQLHSFLFDANNYLEEMADDLSDISSVDLMTKLLRRMKCAAKRLNLVGS